MVISLGQHLVNLEVCEIRRKLAGAGGKNLSPREKAAEIDNTLARISRIRRDRKRERDIFFSTQEFRNVISWLERMRTGGER